MRTLVWTGILVAALGLVTWGAIERPGPPRIPPTEGMTVAELSGLAIYNDAGCAACHAIRDLGGSSGTDLSRAGVRWSASHIREAIVEPEDDDMPSYGGLPDEQLDDLVTYLKSLRQAAEQK